MAITPKMRPNKYEAALAYAKLANDAQLPLDPPKRRDDLESLLKNPTRFDRTDEWNAQIVWGYVHAKDGGDCRALRHAVRAGRNGARRKHEGGDPAGSIAPNPMFEMPRMRAKAALIRKRLFLDPRAALPELARDVAKLVSLLEATQPESPEEIAALRHASFDYSSATNPLHIIDEYVDLRSRLGGIILRQARELLLNPNTIEYGPWIELAQRASLVLTRLPDTLGGQWSPALILYRLRQELTLLGQEVESPDSMNLADWEMESYPRYRRQMEEVVASAPRHIFLVVFEPFDIRRINRGLGDNDSFGELSEGVSKADSVERNSSNYFDHDINHAHMHLAPDTLMNWTSPHVTQSDFGAIATSRAAFKDACQDAILREIGQPLVFDAIWYRIFHERIGNFTRTTVPDPASMIDLLSNDASPRVTSNLAREMVYSYGISEEQAAVYAKQAASILLRVAREAALPLSPS